MAGPLRASRRAFLAGAAASLAMPAPSWADIGAPAYLAAAQEESGRFVICGLDRRGDILFRLPLAARGHAAAAHPVRAEGVAFARRPGRFALVINCATGGQIAQLDAPPGRHFYGHGVFSQDGRILFTTENDLETLEGRIGLWDAQAGYRRMGEIALGGIGPHDIARLPGRDVLVVANGGIATHPESGRTALNPATMRANLSYVTPEGALVERVELAPELRQNSIRHLAVRTDGMVAAAMQWQGARGTRPALLLTHQLGTDEGPRLLAAPDANHRALQNYAGSVSFSGDGAQIAITSPRGGQMHRFDAQSGAFVEAVEMQDVCGLAPMADGFLMSAGTGELAHLGATVTPLNRVAALRWDNHVVPL